MLSVAEFNYCAAELPTEVADLITRKMQILAAPIGVAVHFEDYSLQHCAEYAGDLRRGGALRDGVMYKIENAGKCTMRLTDGAETKDYRKSPRCLIHGCTHDW